MIDTKYLLKSPEPIQTQTEKKDTGLAEIIATIVITGIAAAAAIGAGSIINSLNTETINRSIYNQFYSQYTLC